MAILLRFFHNSWVGLLALLIGIPLVFFVLAKAAEGYLRSEHRVGEWSFRVHGVRVSPLLFFRADSAIFRSTRARIFLATPTAGLLDWKHPLTRRPMVRLAADSVEAEFQGGGSRASGPIVFPSLSFIVPVAVDWRILVVRPPGGTTATLERAQWRSQGLKGLQGRGYGRWQSGAKGPGHLEGDLFVESRWRGGNLRYRVEARYGLDSLRVTGVRDRGNLALGEDSLEIYSSNVGAWLSPLIANRLPRLRSLRIRGVVDWRGRYLSLSGAVRSGIFRFVEPSDWAFTLRLDARGGAAALAGKSARGSVGFEGEWQHPPAWLKKPDWHRCTARFSGRAAGLAWKIGRRELPVEFEIPSLRLNPGLGLEGRVITGDSSIFDVHWNGDKPGRWEFSGTISPFETWARIWTDTNMAYRSGQVTGIFENKRLQATARFQGVHAYGAEVDSLVSDQEVTSTGYDLRAARLYSKSGIFQGKGKVEWRKPGAHPGVSLDFHLSHPEFGRLSFAMPNKDSMEAIAEAVHVSGFPFRSAQKLSRFRPYLDGRFSWNLRRGLGDADLDASFTFREKSMRAHAKADWDRDTLRLRDAEMASGSSRLAGNVTLGLSGRSLSGLRVLKPASVAAWSLSARRISIGEILEIARGNRSDGIDGMLDGDLENYGAGGMRGSLELSKINVPALRGNMEIDAVTLTGHGDSLGIEARTSSARHVILSDTLQAELTGLRAEIPRLEARIRSGGFSIRLIGELPQWKSLRGHVDAEGSVPLGGATGRLDQVGLAGDLSVPFVRDWVRELRFTTNLFRLNYSTALDTQWVSGTLACAGGVLRAPDLQVRHSQGGGISAQVEAGIFPPSLRAEFAGPDLTVALSGLWFQTEGVAGRLRWEKGKPSVFAIEAQSGSFRMPGATFGVEGGFERLRLEGALPPRGSDILPKVSVRGRIRDFLFRYKIGFQDVQAFFRSFKRRKSAAPSAVRRSRPWDIDVELEAVGARNRVDTDILRLAFVGDLSVKGVYPYTLFRGKLSGLQGEIGQPSQAYDVRDFEVKWENSTLEEGTVYVEGARKLKINCKPDTKQLCAISIKLDGRLDEMNFGYDTDCGQNAGEPIPPILLIRAVTQGCYPDAQEAGDVKYGEMALNMLEPSINQRLSRVGSKFSGGFIKSTQVSGLGALMGDTSSMESVALEVESKEKYRLSLKGRAGYFPEKKLPNPWEYRLAVEYRPPLEKWVSDSAWQARFQNRFFLETAVETRPPEEQNLDAERQVRKQVGLRYRYRFWDLW